MNKAPKTLACSVKVLTRGKTCCPGATCNSAVVEQGKHARPRGDVIPARSYHV